VRAIQLDAWFVEGIINSERPAGRVRADSFGGSFDAMVQLQHAAIAPAESLSRQVKGAPAMDE